MRLLDAGDGLVRAANVSIPRAAARCTDAAARVTVAGLRSVAHVRALIVHGGAGSLPRDPNGSRAACEHALDVGWAVLAGGGAALDAVVSAVVDLENDPTLNAGVGACLTEAGTVELDASVMEGTTRRAGAVALVRRLRNPILVARVLLEEGRHVFVAGAAAEEIALSHGIAAVDPSSLVTAERAAAWRERRAHLADERPGEIAAATGRDTPSDGEAGTVGAVAVDGAGHVAAATSTGGIAWQRVGRIGDSAVIGAGTFADDRGGAASSTGDGEAIMRATLARAAVDLLRRGLAPERAATLALAEVVAVGGHAGIILVDCYGRVAAAHTTPYMSYAIRRD